MKKAFIHLSVFTFFALVFSLSATYVFAQPAPTVVFSPPEVAKNVNANPNALFRFVINVLIIIGILIALIFLIWGGLRWILSGGDKAKVDAARSTIVASIVGLIIVILAYVIINTVLTLLTGQGIGGFTLPTLTNPEGSVTPR